jgi:hypothetical protein
MLEINLNENIVEEMVLKEIKNKIEKIQAKLTFWDLNELSKQTCMSIGNIKEKFFYDERFPKYKVGGKWYFPAAECEAFLRQWIKEQPKN